MNSSFEIEIKNSQQATTLYLNPLNDKGLTNPFLLEERLYPVDFGYLSTKKTLFTLEIPKNYIVTTFPNSKA